MGSVARRTWTIATDDGPHRVELADEYWLGERVVTVDGTVAYRGRTVLSDHSGEYPFLIGGAPAILRITTNGLTYRYEVFLTGRDRPAGRPREPAGPGQLIAMGILFLALSLPMLAVFGLQVLHESLLAADPRTADGIVQAKRTFAGRSSTSYELQYLFVAEGGRIVVGRDTVSRASWEVARPGLHYRVRYAAADPEVNRITDKTAVNLGGGAALILMEGGVFAFGVITVLRSRRMARLARELPARGTLARATVTKVSRPRRGRGVGMFAVLRYRYDDGGGTSRTGSRSLFLSDAADWPVGSTPWIRYDPEHPKDSIWIGASPNSVSSSSTDS